MNPTLGEFNERAELVVNIVYVHSVIDQVWEYNLKSVF